MNGHGGGARRLLDRSGYIHIGNFRSSLMGMSQGIRSRANTMESGSLVKISTLPSLAPRRSDVTRLIDCSTDHAHAAQGRGRGLSRSARVQVGER